MAARSDHTSERDQLLAGLQDRLVVRRFTRMPTSRQRRSFQRTRHEMVRASHSGLDRISFTRLAADLLREAMVFDGACWHTVDPASLLITSHHTNLSGAGFALICRNEYMQEDFNKFASVFKPRNIPHTFWNAGSVPARLIEISTPGGVERYMEGLFGMIASGQLTQQAVGELAQRYGLTLIPELGRKLAGEHRLRVMGQPNRR